MHHESLVCGRNAEAPGLRGKGSRCAAPMRECSCRSCVNCVFTYDGYKLGL